MTVSLGQILVVLIIALLLFGNFPNILRDFVKSLKEIMKYVQKDYNELPNKELKRQEKRDSNP